MVVRDPSESLCRESNRTTDGWNNFQNSLSSDEFMALISGFDADI